MQKEKMKSRSTKLYDIGESLPQACEMLQLDVEVVLSALGLPRDFLTTSNGKVDRDTFFEVWQTCKALSGEKDIELNLARGYAHGPFSPALFAYSCAETVGAGLERLSQFKTLIAPLTLSVTSQPTRTDIQFLPVSDGDVLPPSVVLFEIIYIVECARTFTGKTINPIAVILSDDDDVSEDVKAFLGCNITIGSQPLLSFCAQDAAARQVSRNPSLWESLEPVLKERVLQQEQQNDTTQRVMDTLQECLPAGDFGISSVAKRLNMSTRTLQRKLLEEGTNFQEVLRDQRSAMARGYLRDSKLTMPEISYLLGFQSLPSFYRVFQKTEGTTPKAFRERSKT